MPQIPIRTTARQVRDISLGRVEEKAALPGIGEQVQLRQFDALLRSGTDVAQFIFSRYDKKKREEDDLAANEAYLKYVGSSRQKELEFDQTKPPDSKGLFLRWKKEQDQIYENASAGLTEDQLKIFNVSAAKYGLETNTRIAGKERSLHEKRIRDNYEGSALAAETSAFDNLANQKLFYSNINEARNLQQERLRLDGVDEKKIQDKDKKYFSSAVRKGVLLMSAISYPRAEEWFDQALKDGELTTQDAIGLKADLSKRKKANQKREFTIQSQETLDKIFATEGIDQKIVFDFIRNNYEGDFEERLIKDSKTRFEEIKRQDAENQRKFLTQGKAIIDQSTNAVEARENVNFVMADPTATIATANTLDAYIDDVFVKPARKESDPFALQKGYELVNKNFQGIQTPEETIENAEQLIVMFKPKLSAPDLNKLVEFHRNGGLFGRTTYNDIVRSYEELTGKTRKDISQSKEQQAALNAYINMMAPRLPSDKVVNPFDLRKIGSGIITAVLEDPGGETPVKTVWKIGLGVDETLEEAREKGRELQWLPILTDVTYPMAKQALAAKNELLKERGLAPIPETDANLRVIFKMDVMRLRHQKQ
jgi:hypothetical protein